MLITGYHKLLQTLKAKWTLSAKKQYLRSLQSLAIGHPWLFKYIEALPAQIAQRPTTLRNVSCSENCATTADDVGVRIHSPAVVTALAFTSNKEHS